MKFNFLKDYFLLFVGAVVQALCMVLFLVPGQIAAGGVSGTAQIINHYSGLPIGTMILIGNIPLFIAGWKFLGGRRFLMRTIFTVVAYSILLDGLTPFFPKEGLTRDPFLNALYGGIIGGIGMGLVMRAQGTSGGTDILARFFFQRYAIPVSQSYMMTDAVIALTAGLVFSWQLALYSVVSLYVSGLAAELTMEGSSVVRAATIITDKPQEVAQKIMSDLQRGVTSWQGTGMYSGNAKQILLCVVSRSEISQVKAIVHEADPNAFVVIGQVNEVLGEGFKPLKEK